MITKNIKVSILYYYNKKIDWYKVSAWCKGERITEIHTGQFLKNLIGEIVLELLANYYSITITHIGTTEEKDFS